MRDLNYQLKQLGINNRDGSFATQAKRAWLLSQIANQLHDLGFRGMSARSLKPKHVQALVRHWQDQKLAVGTIKNRLCAIRWWARKVNRQSAVARTNDFYGVGARRLVGETSKARELPEEHLAGITDPFVRLSLELQRAFGLRREEAIKFRPAYADRGDHLLLKASWTKGGKARQVPIRNATQRELLDRIREQAGTGSLIPADRNFIEQLRSYIRQTTKVGLSKMHGLRHAYAQQRYRELTGRHCPAAGGPKIRTLRTADKQLDREVRQILSRELGHERPEILSIYCGK